MANKVVLVGCGGFGANMVTAIMDKFNAKDVSDTIDFLIIDGSDSNMLYRSEYMDKFWKVPSVDGAGKVRAAAAKEYVEFIKANLSKVPAATMYVLVYSTSGGSGSVIGPTLNRELMSKGALTVNVVLATDNSAKDVENTRNTLAGLANNVRQLKRPIHFMVESSSAGKPSEVDQLVQENILDVMRICGERHVGLDSNDVRSWLDYNQHGIPEALTMIERFSSAEAMKELEGATITTLSLLTNNDNERPNVGAVFNTDGICTSDVDTHFATTTKNMDALRRNCDERYEYYKGTAAGLNLRSAFGDDDNMDDLVL